MAKKLTKKQIKIAGRIYAGSMLALLDCGVDCEDQELMTIEAVKIGERILNGYPVCNTVEDCAAFIRNLNQ